jgi:hypothetical protein
MKIKLTAYLSQGDVKHADVFNCEVSDDDLRAIAQSRVDSIFSTNKFKVEDITVDSFCP